MVTPLRDGMNLIAKEYVAAQDAADPGVLILSKFAGAAEQMTEALIVNPYSIEETADAIRGALEMTLAERCERHGALLAGVQKHDAAAWSQSFLEHLKRAYAVPDVPGRVDGRPHAPHASIYRFVSSTPYKIREAATQNSCAPLPSGTIARGLRPALRRSMFEPR